MNRKPKVNNMNLSYLIDWANMVKQKDFNELYHNELVGIIKNAIELIKSVEVK
jgi:hypothetical protein